MRRLLFSRVNIKSNIKFKQLFVDVKLSHISRCISQLVSKNHIVCKWNVQIFQSLLQMNLEPES